MDDLISVIVPIYNVERYVERCITSIICQTYNNLEIILINDGSTDNSLKICQKYAEIDGRIIIIDQENAGVSAARNAGLTIARGQWIGFVDSDDYIEPDFYECLIKKTFETDADVICCGVKTISESGDIIDHLSVKVIPKIELELIGDEMLYAYFHMTKRFLYWSPWDKLIRAEIAKAHFFEVGKAYGEDFWYCLNCLLDANKVYYIPLPKYNYQLRSTSATHTKTFNDHAFDNYYFASKACELLRQNKINREITCLAEIRRSVIGARLVRKYYSCDKKCSQYDEDISLIRERNRTILIKYWMEIPSKYKLLLLITLFSPVLKKQ